MNLDFDESTMAHLERYSNLRNAAIHDQGVFDCFIGNDGNICLQQKACPIHPTLIRAKDINNAMAAYSEVIRVTCCAVVEQVLKAPDHTELKNILRIFEEMDERVSTTDSEGSNV